VGDEDPRWAGHKTLFGALFEFGELLLGRSSLAVLSELRR